MIYLIAFGIFGIMILLMMIGQLLTKRQIQGSCGGLSQAGIERVCDCEETCAEHRLYQISEPSAAPSAPEAAASKTEQQ